MNGAPRYLPLICLALMHAVVDACALLVAPIWPEIVESFRLDLWALSMVFIVQSLPTSLTQGVFGYVRDRRATPYLIWLGPLTAALFLTMVGLVSTPAALCVLFLVGGVGVGAFHPEAAVMAGSLFPENRTRSLAVFMFGGSLGLAIGPTLSGAVVRQGGLVGLAYLAPLFVVLVPLLWWGIRLRPTPDVARAGVRRSSLSMMLEGRRATALLILLVCSLRLVPNMACDKILSFTIDQRGGDALVTGSIQSLFLASASVGMLWMAIQFRSGWERSCMIVCPLLGIPLLVLLGSESCPHWLFVGLLVPAGLVLWGTTPAMVSYAQQLFPKGGGLASAITMGLAWGLGGLIQAPLTAYFGKTTTPQHAFLSCIPFLAFAALGACYLPKVPAESSTREQSHDVFEFAASVTGIKEVQRIEEDDE